MRLKNAMGLPETIIVKERYRVTSLDSLCILLRRMAYPIRYATMSEEFGRSVSAICCIFLHMVEIISNKYNQLIYFDRRVFGKVEIFKRKILEAGSVVEGIWGFIDGTVRPCCRPVRNQRPLFNGHKRTHAIKFQSILTPDGLICSLYGATTGARNDTGILNESGIFQIIRENFPPNSFLYGDSGYHNGDFIRVPFRGVTNPEEQEINERMSSARVSVEWGFGWVVNKWAFLDYKKNLKVDKKCNKKTTTTTKKKKQKKKKILLSPIGSFYKVGVLLTNCSTCYYGGNQASDKYNLTPPTLEQYLNI
jgi:hypothetical protein